VYKRYKELVPATSPHMETLQGTSHKIRDVSPFVRQPKINPVEGFNSIKHGYFCNVLVLMVTLISCNPEANPIIHPVIPSVNPPPCLWMSFPLPPLN